MKLRPSKTELIVAIAGGLYGACILPVQVLVANPEMFEVGLAKLIPECILLFLLLSISLFVIMHFLNKIAKGLGFSVVISLYVCVYLESGLLSMGLPQINGGLTEFANAWRKLGDAVVWTTVFVIAIIMRKMLAKAVIWIAVAFLVMTSAMIFDSRPVCSASGGDCDFSGKHYCNGMDVLNSIAFSPEKNVFLLILDAFPASAAKKIIDKEASEWQKDFSGFIAFDNNIGMHSFTAKGVPALMTGEFQDEFVPKESVASKIYGDKSLISAYRDLQYNIFLSHSFTFPSYSGIWSSEAGTCIKIKNTSTLALMTVSQSVPYINLIETMLFRISPYVMKPKLLAIVVRRLKKNTEVGKVKREDYVYPRLSEASVSTNLTPSFVCFHTVGVHEPISKGRDGKPVGDTTLVQNASGVVEQGYYAMKQVACFMDALKRMGIYDKSFIVITSDHGSFLMKDGSGNHGAESALLWIKPIDAKGPFVHSDLPTSHCKIANMMRKAASYNLSAKEIGDMLVSGRRRFIATKEHTHWWTMATYYEWIYDENGCIVSCERFKMK